MLEEGTAGKPRRLDSGTLKLGNAAASIPDRLLRLRFGILGVMRAWSPDEAVTMNFSSGENVMDVTRSA